MEKLKEDLNIFILDDSNIHQTTTVCPLAEAEPDLEGRSSSPVRISFTPPPIRRLEDGSDGSPVMLNRIVPIANGTEQSSQLKIIKPLNGFVEAIRMDQRVATGGKPQGEPRGNCAAAPRIESINIESEISDDEYFPNNDIPGTHIS